MADLVVELYGTLIGKLTGDWRTFDLMLCAIDESSQPYQSP